MAAEIVSMLDIVYDGRCAFCLRALRLCRWLARRDVFRFDDANEGDAVRARFPILGGADTEAAMFVITEQGEVFRGFFAFRRMMWASPWLFPHLLLFYAPGASLVGPRIYAWVARHRQSYGCASAACELQAPPNTKPESQV